MGCRSSTHGPNVVTESLGFVVKRGGGGGGRQLHGSKDANYPPRPCAKPPPRASGQQLVAKGAGLRSPWAPKVSDAPWGPMLHGDECDIHPLHRGTCSAQVVGYSEHGDAYHRITYERDGKLVVHHCVSVHRLSLLRVYSLPRPAPPMVGRFPLGWRGTVTWQSSLGGWGRPSSYNLSKD